MHPHRRDGQSSHRAPASLNLDSPPPQQPTEEELKELWGLANFQDIGDSSNLGPTPLLPSGSTPGDMSQQPRTRPKEGVAGDEEAAGELKLGEFAQVPTLSNSEVKLLLSAVKEKRQASGRPMPETE